METLSKVESLVLNSILEKKKVIYYINGTSYRLDCSSGKYAIFSRGKKLSLEDRKYAYALSVFLSSHQIKTTNPQNICLDFILDEEKSFIQITNIFSKNRNLTTEKIVRKYKENLENVTYGDVKIISKFANFDYEKFALLKEEEFTENHSDDIISEITVSKKFCNALFKTCCIPLVEKDYQVRRAEVCREEGIKIAERDGRIQRIYRSCF